MYNTTPLNFHWTTPVRKHKRFVYLVRLGRYAGSNNLHCLGHLKCSYDHRGDPYFFLQPVKVGNLTILYSRCVIVVEMTP
jgi:hypothetical protein